MGEWKKDVRTMLSCTAEAVYTTGRIKYYPNADGVMEIGSVDFFEGHGKFRRKGFENNDVWVSDYHTIHDPSLDEVTFNPLTGEYVTKWGYVRKADKPPRNIPEKYDVVSGTDKGRRRAMVKIFDYIRCNWDFDCMFTMTFDETVINRTSYDDIIKKVGQWFSNRVRRNNLKYIAVPEFHSDGSAIHLHGVCNFEALQTKYSRVRQGGKGVYNIIDFPYGFTAVKKIGDGRSDRHAVAVYVSKYITKDSEKVGGRYFLHGGKLLSPTVELCSIDRETADAIAEAYPCKVFECNTPNGGRYVKYEVQHYKNGE